MPMRRTAFFSQTIKRIYPCLNFQGMAMCLLCIVLASCTNAQQNEMKLENYDLNKPEKFFMPGSLEEISGIAFLNGNPDTVYAIQDEEGKLFKLRWNEKKQTHIKFGKRGDYEDLSILNGKVFVLKSNGKIFSFSLSRPASDEAEDVKEWSSLLPSGEYEGLFGDEQTRKLYVLCKNCPADKGNHQASGFIFQATDSLVPQGGFSLDLRSITPFSARAKHGLRASALAKNPVTGEWFILSSVNKLLIVADGHWKIKNAVHLNANEFNQPEGIAFDSRGNLYISNEGGDLSEGNILRFARHPK